MLAEAAKPFEGMLAVHASGIMLIDERHGRLGPSGAMGWQLLDSFIAGGRTALYCARCRRSVLIEHDDLHRVARNRNERALTLTPGTAR